MKIAIIYYTHTGNTRSIAEYLYDYFSKDHQAEIHSIQTFKGSIDPYDLVLFGCPALGNEGIDALYMEPFVEAVPMKGKHIALFGSYGWGNGEWMLDWSKKLKTGKKARVFSEYLTIKGSVEDADINYVKAFVNDLERWIEREISAC